MHAQNPTILNPSIGEPAPFYNAASDELTETQDLTWRFLDGIIEDDQFERLQTLLTENEASRLEYADALQLHADLLSLAGKL